MADIKFLGLNYKNFKCYEVLLNVLLLHSKFFTLSKIGLNLFEMFVNREV